MSDLRILRYKRHEFRHQPKWQKGTLLTFVYDIPYFPPCGIFPPLHILNQILSDGGGDGGMSPGASWEPFTLEIDEYESLVEAIKTTPIIDIEPHARYAHVPLKFDSSFDQLTSRWDWMKAVCEKHRDSWHAELRKAGKLA